ncbi:MAG: hypothetical protein FWF94_04055 [Oscillospiraceae bacterium]|nr:hypothetical protein [Oscillospiraceae bacterium]
MVTGTNTNAVYKPACVNPHAKNPRSTYVNSDISKFLTLPGACHRAKYDTFTPPEDENLPEIVLEKNTEETVVEEGESKESELTRLLKESESTAKVVDTLGKALKIMSRIIAGDIVPDKDDRFLLENYPEMHLKAWLLRRQREEEDIKKYKSVLDEKDNNMYPVFANADAISAPSGFEASYAAVNMLADLDVCV